MAIQGLLFVVRNCGLKHPTIHGWCVQAAYAKAKKAENAAPPRSSARPGGMPGFPGGMPAGMGGMPGMGGFAGGMPAGMGGGMPGMGGMPGAGPGGIDMSKILNVSIDAELFNPLAHPSLNIGAHHSVFGEINEQNCPLIFSWKSILRFVYFLGEIFTNLMHLGPGAYGCILRSGSYGSSSGRYDCLLPLQLYLYCSEVLLMVDDQVQLLKLSSSVPI